MKTKTKRNKNKMITTKKAAAAGQVFIYIMAMIVFAIIVLVGYKAISGFIDKAEQVNFAAFKTDMERAVNDIYGDFGSVVVYDAKNPLRVSGKFDEVCFLDLDWGGSKTNTDICKPGQDSRPLLCSVWDDSPPWHQGAENVLLFPILQESGGVSVYKITLDTDGDYQENHVKDEGWLCVPVVNGRIDIRIEGKGSHAFISAIEESSVNSAQFTTT